ncbi:MAG: AroB-related putative sugar phosphate phospholyase (cyclizing) [Promethearchaeota archaeon]
MSAYNKLNIKSNLRDYFVNFVDDFYESLENDSKEKSFILIDQNVYNLYKEKIQDFFQPSRYILIEAKESHKTLDYAQFIIKFLINNNIKRNDRLIAIGGGIIQDITGFVSSILFRGIEWIFYPTTLLAQGDSCIGSKTSINVDDLKNQLGTFYPPHHVIIDVNFLKTLNDTEIKSGLGEIIKVHLLDGSESMEFVSKNYESSKTDDDIIKELIFRSLNIKKGIIEKDEFDREYRNILNYGHSFGHAIESLTEYGICHGQAVTVGMDMANYVSLKMEILSDKMFNSMREALIKNLPDFQLDSDKIDKLLFALSKDKKNVDDYFNLILTRGPGKMEKLKTKNDDKFQGFLKDYSTFINDTMRK